jgi:acyl CoA:acetate/3-ketoacid CoA transferase alpha subunit
MATLTNSKAIETLTNFEDGTAVFIFADGNGFKTVFVDTDAVETIEVRSGHKDLAAAKAYAGFVADVELSEVN